jgi:soluble lytic murein transglycosylase-like protein
MSHEKRALLALLALGLLYWTYPRRSVAAPEAGDPSGALLAELEAAFSRARAALGEIQGALPSGEVISREVAEGFENIMNTVAPGAWPPPARAAPYLAAIAQAEDKYSIPPQLLARLLYQESRYRPEIIDGSVRSSAGAIGIAQFMPATAAEMGVDPLNADSSIDGAARYLRRLYDGTGTWAGALAAYNWGIGNVRRRGLGAAPAETREYVSAILGDVGLA